jgi:hypothetical protein
MPDAAAGAGAGDGVVKAAWAGGAACGAASFMAATKGEPKGSEGGGTMSEGVLARCCACGVNKLEMDTCGCAVAAESANGGSAAAWEKGDCAAAGWDGMPKGFPLEPPPIEKGDAAGADAAAPAEGWDGVPKGDPLAPVPNENGDPAAGTGACCGAGCASENGLAEAPD